MYFYFVLDEEPKDDSPHMSTVRTFSQNILEIFQKNEAEMTAFDEFSLEVMNCLRDIFKIH